MWNPCLPGVSPVMSATTVTPSLPLVNVTVPATLLPEAALNVAIAFVVSPAIALGTLLKERIATTATKKNEIFRFIAHATPIAMQVQRQAGQSVTAARNAKRRRTNSPGFSGAKPTSTLIKPADMSSGVIVVWSHLTKKASRGVAP